MDPMGFPNEWTRVFSATVHVIGPCALTFCIARRTAAENLSTFRSWRELGIAKLCVLLCFCDSLLFLLTTGILTHGAGLQSIGACMTGILTCIMLYATSKVFIYMFLAERVWIVWSSTHIKGNPARFKSPIYLWCLASITIYLTVFPITIYFRIAELSNRCYIGFQWPGSMLVLTYDCYITLLLTSLFVYPLWKNRVMSYQLRKMTRRTCLASVAALATSTANIAVLTSFHGKEAAWICLLSCGSDVTMNALIIYFVTQTRKIPTLQPPLNRSKLQFPISGGGWSYRAMLNSPIPFSPALSEPILPSAASRALSFRVNSLMADRSRQHRRYLSAMIDRPVLPTANDTSLVYASLHVTSNRHAENGVPLHMPPSSPNPSSLTADSPAQPGIHSLAGYPGDYSQYAVLPTASPSIPGFLKPPNRHQHESNEMTLAEALGLSSPPPGLHSP